MLSIIVLNRDAFFEKLPHIYKKRSAFIETNALALMVAASSCAGVRHKRYSEQQEIAPKKSNRNGWLLLEIFW
jgi:hypothetical protein